MGAKKLSETAREREVFKYYQPTNATNSQTPDIAPRPQSSRDTALTAFAQLGALRLGARRAFISLVTREHQYFIAEATRTLSLRSDDVFEPADQLWKGETTGRRDEGPSSVAMDLFTGVIEGNREYLLVSNMSTDDRFCRTEAVSRSPFMKSCVVVPLLSPRGLVIGTFSVVDDKSRDGISSVEIAFMQDIASTIMAHLEAKRLKQQHRRAERMIRGLGLFVEGKSSLREWWLITGHKTNESEVTEKTRRGESLNQQPDKEFGVQDLPDDLATASIASIPLSLATGRPPLARDNSRTKFNVHARDSRLAQDSRCDTQTARSASTLPSQAADTTFTADPGISITLSTAQSSTASNEPIQAVPQSPPSSSTNLREEAPGPELQEAGLSDKLKETFSRASNLIRESISIDGVLFVDASIGTFGGSSTRAEIEFIGPAARKARASPLETSSSDESLSGEGTAETNPPKMCGILGYSTSTRSSLKMHETSLLHTQVPETFLRKLLRRYPHGKVFNFDEEGSLSSSEEDVRKLLREGIENTSETAQLLPTDAKLRKRGKRKMTREAEAKEILRLLPSARCVAFFPLWDSHKERWMAGTLVWTTNPTRILDTEEDLTYLASFGNSIMAEISRLNALLSSQLKNSFLSSISHELRSPLHGVLASVEFLQDTPLTAFQQEMTSIIGSCGRTLLDTLNHVLDYAKLRRPTTHRGEDTMSRSRSRRARRGSASAGTPSSHKATSVDLRVLTEEVLEGVYAGGGLARNTSHHNSPSESSHHASVSFFAPQPLPPVIILDLAWRDNWRFDIDPGAWRRLVMNIFGNALKYTESGFVRISLKESSSNETSLSNIIFTITDSGKGISKEFLNHHLYTAFAQEDSLAAGSGLGLSIVRHIVKEAGGTIDISSEQDLGTAVTIKLPLAPAISASPSDDDGVMIHKTREQLQGLDACLVGFDVFPSLVDEPTGILSVEAKMMFHFKDSLTALLTDWFGLDVSVKSTLNPSPDPISVVTDAVFNDLMASGRLAQEGSNTGDQKPVILVLCAQPQRSHPAIVQSSFHIVHIQPLIGPHKLAQVLISCLPFITPSAVDTPLDETSHRGPQQASIDIAQGDMTPTPPGRPVISRNTSSQRSESTLPLSPSNLATAVSLEDSPASKGSGSGSPGAESSSRYVLLVEDNAINLKILVTHMKKLGIGYATAHNGLLAVQTYRSSARPFDLVMMDISMPVMDGLEASRQIRLFEVEAKRSRVPIVAITGAAEESMRQEAFSAGIDRFLTKPASLKVMREMVEAYVKEGEIGFGHGRKEDGSSTVS